MTGAALAAPAVDPRQLENMLDQIWPNERSGGVMDRDKFGLGRESLHPAIDRILPSRATRKHAETFRKRVSPPRCFRSQRAGPMCPTRMISVTDSVCSKAAIECATTGIAIERREKLVETHPLAADRRRR